MPSKKAVSEFFRRAEETFWQRNSQYGTTGMSKGKAASLASTKLDRIINGSVGGDSEIDLANYALIISLLNSGDWFPDDVAASKELVDLSSHIRVKSLNGEKNNIRAPQKAGDVGFDLVSSVDSEISPFGSIPSSVPCDFAMKLPDGYWAEIRPRSSTPTKLGILVHQSVMDSGYVGPWFVVANSITGAPVRIPKGTRLAQCIIHKSVVPELTYVDELPETDRGSGGFGSTGLM